MTLRKIAGLLAAFGLTLGLIGGGVGAVFTDTLTATENIEVGTFSCIISAATAGATGVGTKSVSYTAPKISSSAAGSAPFSFTVQNTGSINQQLTITAGGPFGGALANFSTIPLVPVGPVALAAGASQPFTTGIQWTGLDNSNLGESGSFTWTVACGELAPTTPLINYTFKSTNADNIAGTAPGHAGTIGPNVTAVDNGARSITLNFTSGTAGTFASCFEYVSDNNVPQQKLATNGGVNYNNGTSDGDPIVLDGLFPFVCVSGTQPTRSVTLTGIGYVDVRMAFGAESDYRFDWTRFNALP